MLIDLGENKTSSTVLEKLEAVVLLYPRANQLPPYYLMEISPLLSVKSQVFPKQVQRKKDNETKQKCETKIKQTKTPTKY